jgi:hypothetical protein
LLLFDRLLGFDHLAGVPSGGQFYIQEEGQKLFCAAVIDVAPQTVEIGHVADTLFIGCHHEETSISLPESDGVLVIGCEDRG